MQTATWHNHKKQFCCVQSHQMSQKVTIEAGETTLSSAIIDKAERVYREVNKNFIMARVLELLVCATCQGRKNRLESPLTTQDACWLNCGDSALQHLIASTLNPLAQFVTL